MFKEDHSDKEMRPMEITVRIPVVSVRFLLHVADQNPDRPIDDILNEAIDLGLSQMEKREP